MKRLTSSQARVLFELADSLHRFDQRDERTAKALERIGFLVRVNRAWPCHWDITPAGRAHIAAACVVEDRS